MITRHKCAECDNCKCAIDYYHGDMSNKSINEELVSAGCVIKGRKLFCDEKCYEEYRKRNER